MSEKLKLLICSPFPLDRRLGAPKVLIEIGEGLASCGWEISLVDQDQMLRALSEMGIEVADTYQENLRRYLREVSGRFDVVEYDHEYLPFPRSEFSPDSLLVARSVLFALHHRRIDIPRLRRSRDLVLDWFRRPRVAISEERVARTEESLRQADLINVSNTHDLEEIRRSGLGAEKTCVFPYGLDPLKMPKESASEGGFMNPPRVVFVGTFDERKGGADFPALFGRIYDEIPGIQFRMLGTSGIYPTAREVKAFFPRQLQSRLEVIPRYEPEKLPELLQDCSIGVFPSYLEGFAFAVLEMMASSLPVLAYDAPGACDILNKETLVPSGQREEMARRVIEFLENPEKLARARTAAKIRSQDFRWDQIARDTDKVYREALGRHRALAKTG